MELLGTSGLVLCGGASSRMGRDKARVELDGRPLLAHALAVFDALGVPARLACGAQPRYAEFARECVLDDTAGAGPLAGLTVGLEAAARAGDDWVAVLACDMPRARAEVLARLLAHARREGLAACLAGLERGSQPAYAVYHTRCAVPARAALEAGERRLVAFHGALAVGVLPLERDAATALNLNTPDELARATAEGSR
ncbi:MAG TPA: molybdenum cofactor guanylyltransferase [Planctomycetota bacterium]|nr:molybdenum cofactor guanylyltransferase [Planctomycetota bacterium]